jgi:hypothetical protein
MSDAVFTDKDSMSEADIQNFLNQKIGSCDINGTRTSEYGGGTRAQYARAAWGASPPFTCLNRYYEVPKTEAGGAMPANNYSNPDVIPTGAKSAAWIIKDAANRYNISPRVLLVKIATESSGPLTSDQWPLYSQYKYAMGSHCPDSGPGGSANCDAAYAGFSIQIYSAAELLRWYLDSMNEPWWSYKKPHQNNPILWNVEPRGCGSSNVYIESKATAALYTYTPYQPNNAALNNMYGTGDNCSAYGNRNFWRTYVDWFGDSRTSPVSTQLPSGDYYISSVIAPTMSIGFALDNNLKLSPKAAPGTALRLTRGTDGYYTIANIATGKVFDIPAAEAKTGAVVQQWESNNSTAQKWLIQINGNGSFTISPKLDYSLALDLTGASTANGTPAWLYDKNNSAAQKFYLVPVANPVEDGIYVLSSKINQNLGLDVVGGSSANGANAQIYEDNFTNAQRWQLAYNQNTGYHTIKGVGSGKVLDVNAASSTNGTNIHIWESNGSCAQSWRVKKNTDGSIEFISACSGKVLDVAGGRAANGTNVQLWESNSTNAQKWLLNQNSGSLIVPGIYKIVSGLSANKVLDVNAAGSANGTNVQLWDSNGSLAQKWQVEYNPTKDTYKITNVGSGKLLDVLGAGSSDGTNIHIWESNGSCAQSWRVKKYLDGTVELVSACSNKALDVAAAKTANGTNIQLWSRNISQAQKWVFGVWQMPAVVQPTAEVDVVVDTTASPPEPLLDE